MIHDMTAGKPLKLILFFSIPLLIGNILQQLYFFADMAIVSKAISQDAMAAVGATGAVGFLIFGFYYGLTNGLAVITAQRFGAKDEAGVRRSVAISILISLAVSLLGMAVALPSVRRLLQVMETPPDIMEDALLYMVIMCWGMISIVFYNLASCLMRALGDSWTPLVFLAVACVLNIGLDILFIVPLGWGIAGAAWATIASQIIAAFLSLGYMWKYFPLLRPRLKDWRPRLTCLREHLRVSMPMAFQFSITAVGVMVMQRQINTFGSEILAGFTVGCRFEQIAVQPMFTMGVAVATFSAQNFGAGRLDRVIQSVPQCTVVSVIWSLASGLFLILCSRPLLAWMLDMDHGVTALNAAYEYVYMVSALFVILGQLFIYRNVLQGVGRPFIPMMAGVAELVIRIVAALALARFYGYLGAFWATPAAWIGATGLLFAGYWVIFGRLKRECAATPLPREAPLSGAAD